MKRKKTKKDTELENITFKPYNILIKLYLLFNIIFLICYNIG